MSSERESYSYKGERVVIMEREEGLESKGMERTNDY